MQNALSVARAAQQGKIAPALFRFVSTFQSKMASLASMGFDLANFLPMVGMIYIPLLLALCVHEWAHAMMSKVRGDNTAEMMGRLTLNPVAHMDPIGTVAFPLLGLAFGSPVFFGWAKPVPYDPRNLKNPRIDAFWIALAGPLSNVVLAILAAGVLGVLARMVPTAIWSSAGSMIDQPLGTILFFFIRINLFLAIFNMIPLHPLDGGKVLARFLPARVNDWLEQNEQMTGLILIGLLLLGAFAILAIPVQFATQFLVTMALGGLL